MPPLLPNGAARRVCVVGPAYVDEIVRVDGPLCPPDWQVAAGRAGRHDAFRLDYTVTEARREGLPAGDVFLDLCGACADRIRVVDGGRRSGRRVRLREPRIVGTGSGADLPPLDTRVGLAGAHEEPGGMGPGYALALGARLVTAVGGRAGTPDATGQALTRAVAELGVDCRAVVVDGAATDTTLILMSPVGDKLPVARRSSSARCTADALVAAVRADAAATDLDVSIVTSLPNPVAAAVAERLGGWKLFAPSLRNCRSGPLGPVARAVDAMAMNATEWGAVEDADVVRGACDLIAVTRGAAGASVLFRDAAGQEREADVAAAEAPGPVVDTNHAGEAFAAALVGELILSGALDDPRGGGYHEETVREAAVRASWAAALAVRRAGMAFPRRDEVAAARRELC